MLNAGYRVSFSHAALSSLKTDAPMSFIWDVICAWKQKFTEEAAAKSLLPPKRVSTDEAAGANATTDKQKCGKRTVKKHPPSEMERRVVDALMARPLDHQKIDFAPHPDCNPASRSEKLVR